MRHVECTMKAKVFYAYQHNLHLTTWPTHQIRQVAGRELPAKFSKLKLKLKDRTFDKNWRVSVSHRWTGARGHNVTSSERFSICSGKQSKGCGYKHLSHFNQVGVFSCIRFFFLLMSWNPLDRQKTHKHKRSYLEECMKPWFLFLTPNNGLFAHFKEVDKGGVGLHQLFRL